MPDQETSATTYIEQALHVVKEHIELAEPIVFVIGLAESLVVVSLFVPSTLLLIGLGGLHSAAGGNFLSVWAAAAAGAFIGDIISFAFGRWFKRDLARIWPFRGNRKWLARARLFFRKWGILGIIASKFLGMMRPFVPVVAGALRMRWLLFLVASAISAMMWAAVFLAPGYGLTAALQ